MPTVSLYEKVITFSNVSSLSFESLGQLVKTVYMLNHVIECEVCLTFNGNNFMNISLGTLTLAVSHSVLKENTTEFQM